MLDHRVFYDGLVGGVHTYPGYFLFRQWCIDEKINPDWIAYWKWSCLESLNAEMSIIPRLKTLARKKRRA